MPLERQALSQSFGDLWHVHNRGFTALLIECRRLFDGDMDQLLILSVIGERTLTAERARGLTNRDFLQGRPASGKQLPINTQSMADCTGIPRETVRRKISHLINRGWVKKNEDATLEATENAALELAPATDVALDYFFSLGNLLLTTSRKLPGQSEASRPLLPRG